METKNRNVVIKVEEGKRARESHKANHYIFNIIKIFLNKKSVVEAYKAKKAMLNHTFFF